jgi:tetratricopeptide (TPR) repeat protein
MAAVPPELAAEVQKLERYHAENPQGRYFVPLANAYRKTGAIDQAEALLREGLRRHPDYLSAHIVLGRCLADRGAVDDAVGEFRYVLSVDPQNLIALRSLGEMASEVGRTDEAARWYRELLAVDPMNEDARQALDALESRPAPAEQEQGGAAWWEQPAPGAQGADEGLPASGVVDDDLLWSGGGEGGEAEAPAAGEGDDALTWGAVELDVTVGTDAAVEGNPAPEPFGALSFGDLELADAGEPAGPAEDAGEPWADAGAGEAGGGWDPYAGSTVELETPRFADDEGDAPAVPEGDGEEVVTETIAELYARQGFHDRAADVYRELIRRRGGDPALEARLREVERLAAGEPADEPVAEAEPSTETDDLPLLEWSIEEASTAEPEPFAAAAAEDDDVFAGSFDAGFGEVAPGAPANTGADLPGFDDETPVPWDSGDDSEAAEVAAIFAGEESFFAAPAAEAAPEEEAPAPSEPAAYEEDEPIVVASAAAGLLADTPEDEAWGEETAEQDTPFADAGFAADEPLAAADFGTPEPASGGFAGEEPYGDEAETEEPAAETLPEPEVVVEFRSVREYLSGIAAWQPSAPVASPVQEAAAGMEQAAPAGAVEPEEVAPTTMEEAPAAAQDTPAAEFHDAAVEDEEDDMPWLAAPVSDEPGAGQGGEPLEIDGLLEAESAGAAASAGGAGDEPYPWEAAPAAEPAASEASPGSAFSFEEFFVEAAGEPEAPAAPAPAAPAAPEPPRAGPPAPPAAASTEDDEDLESFQAWLQSLKR